MAYPVGPTPSADVFNSFGERTTPSKSKAFTTGTDMDLTDPTNGLTPCCTEIFCTTSGSVVARLAGDTVDQTYAVVASQVLRGVFTFIRAASISCILRQ